MCPENGGNLSSLVKGLSKKEIDKIHSKSQKDLITFLRTIFNGKKKVDEKNEGG